MISRAKYILNFLEGGAPEKDEYPNIIKNQPGTFRKYHPYSPEEKIINKPIPGLQPKAPPKFDYDFAKEMTSPPPKKIIVNKPIPGLQPKAPPKFDPAFAKEPTYRQSWNK